METIVAAVIGAGAGLASGILVTLLGTRLREANPRLSLVFQSTHSLTARALGTLRRRVEITYDAEPVKSLHVCKASFRNTGNQILTGVGLLFVAAKEGKLLTPEAEVPDGIQLGGLRLTPGDTPQTFRCGVDHVLPQDRFSITFLAADTDPNEVVISVETPPCRIRRVGRLETPMEQLRDAFRTDPARFALQLLAPLVAMAMGVVVAVLAATSSD